MDAGKVYIAWAVYIAALAAHLLYWKIAPASIALRRAGVPADAVAQVFWLVALSQLSLCAWPFVAAAKERPYDDPRVFSTLLLVFASAAAAFGLAAAAGWIWAAWANGSPNPARALKSLGASVIVVSLGGAAVAYWIVVT